MKKKLIDTFVVGAKPELPTTNGDRKMKVTKFTQAACGQVATGAIAALEAYAATLGLAVEREGRGTFDRDGSTFQFKVKFTVGGDQGLEEKKRTEFNRWAPLYGLEASDYMREFDYGSTRYRLTGIATRRRKYPYECVNLRTGKDILLPETAKLYIERARSLAA